MQFQQLRSLERFCAPIQPLSLLPPWAQPKALSNLGNISNDDISRENLVVIHSEGKEARKLEGFAEFRGSLDVGDRILEGVLC